MIRDEVAGGALNWSSLKPAWADRLSFMGGGRGGVSCQPSCKGKRWKMQKTKPAALLLGLRGQPVFSRLIKESTAKNNNLLSVSS